MDREGFFCECRFSRFPRYWEIFEFSCWKGICLWHALSTKKPQKEAHNNTSFRQISHEEKKLRIISFFSLRFHFLLHHVALVLHFFCFASEKRKQEVNVGDFLFLSSPPRCGKREEEGGKKYRSRAPPTCLKRVAKETTKKKRDSVRFLSTNKGNGSTRF